MKDLTLDFPLYVFFSMEYIQRIIQEVAAVCKGRNTCVPEYQWVKPSIGLEKDVRFKYQEKFALGA
jgi:hypothetical protein